MSYNHGVRVEENPTSLTVPIEGTAGLQVIFGTAPINLADDPYSVTNELIIAYSYKEAVAALGYSNDFKKYTLCQSIYASFKVFNVAPIILCNVLDPKKHKKTNEEKTLSIIKSQALLEIEGVLLDTIIVKNGESILTEDTDYICTFNENGYVIITLTNDKIQSIKVSCDSIDPSAVTKDDIIGGYNVSTGKETGLELVRKVYPKFGFTPGLLLAPGWSHIPTVGVALAAKSTEINGSFSCENLTDLDSSSQGATKYTDCKELKERCGYTNKHSILLWPQIKLGEMQFAYSAIMGALIAYTDAENDDVPNLSPSNKLLGVSGTVLEDGTEVILDQTQANVINGQGIVTAINVNGWRSWGNNTAIYPASTDPKDRWISCRRFFSWWGNSFILTYFQKVDSPANYRLIESIVDTENIRGNSYVAQGKCAGCRIEYNANDNPITDLLNGKIQFKQWLAPYTPAEDIFNVLEFDPDMIEAALSGGES
ncbi:Phage tail sheath protein FI [Clostridium neonatale]|uniref:phage tail sheath family protein n=1 Tax=Clostridium neonatale TaxID=137838 RepID=UPI00291BE978|nr:phage tail sheath family protein [Clostridium neonatale]CAI3224226.1 Phage tail sheath protein FI [Clostridium neonatale]